MQTTTSDFDSAAVDVYRQPKTKVWVSWDRSKNASKTFAIVGTTQVGDDDIIQGEFDQITEPDLFDFTDESDYIQSFTVDRELNEPLGGFAYADGDVVLVNATKRYTPGYDVTIGDYILPHRPIKLFGGFYASGQDKVIPLMYGLTKQPLEGKSSRQSKIEIIDYLSYIEEYELESTVYVDQRSDEIIDDILTTIGFSSSQYVLDTGLNTIGFAWFDKGTKAGDAIRKICEAEEGFFYQDEFGVIRFHNRRHYNVSPYNSYVWTFDAEEVITWEQEPAGQIINRAEVKASPREVQETTEIWVSGEIIELDQGTTNAEYWANFDDPANAITTPVAGTDYIANTEQDGSGTDMTSFVSLSITKFTTSAKFSITNTYLGKIYITRLALRGDPAVVVTPIKEIYEDTTSQETYGVQAVEIENDYITEKSFAAYLSKTLVEKYKNPLKRLKVTVRAVPQLQIRDRIRIEDPDDIGTYVEYRIMRMQLSFSTSGFLHTLILREITDAEADSVAIVGTSVVGGVDVVGI